MYRQIRLLSNAICTKCFKKVYSVIVLGSQRKLLKPYFGMLFRRSLWYGIFLSRLSMLLVGNLRIKNWRDVRCTVLLKTCNVSQLHIFVQYVMSLWYAHGHFFSQTCFAVPHPTYPINECLPNVLLYYPSCASSSSC